MVETVYFRTRLRNKGQITVPSEIRSLLGAEEGDDLVFYTDEQGRILISRAQLIPPEQAWFWNERWQRMEREAQADLEAGRFVEFHSPAQALDGLDQAAAQANAED
jgi:AbrB family looped-hinge helix DNA binding protein